MLVALGTIPRRRAAVHVRFAMGAFLVPGRAAVLRMATVLLATMPTAPPRAKCALLDRIRWEGLLRAALCVLRVGD